MYYTAYYESPIGRAMLGSDGVHLIGLWLEGQKYFGGSVKELPEVKHDLPVFTAVKSWLDCYFAGKKPSVSELPLAPAGSEFRQAVYRILCEIPYGQVVTYGEIAEKIAEKMNRKRMSGQAVGGAVGHNPISIIIPCHRVVGRNGSLTGYAGGIDKKLRLLELEGADLSRLYVPKKALVHSPQDR